MARLTCSRSGWGSVRDPETGERVPIGADISPDQADRLADHYGPITVDASDRDEDEGEDEDAGEDDTEDDDDLGLREASHDELKEMAAEAGIADDVDLRSKGAIVEALADTDTDTEFGADAGPDGGEE